MTAASNAADRGPGQSLPGGRVSAGLLVSAAITALTFVGAFGLIALDVEYFWVVFVLGFGVALPTALGVVAYATRQTDSRDTPQQGQNSPSPLDELRRQYARGELTESEFEHRAEVLTEHGDEQSEV